MRLKFASFINQINTQSRAILLVSAFIMLTGNFSLFSRILEIYPLSLRNTPFLLSLTAFFSILTALFFLIICHARATRWILAFFLVFASQAAYHMDQFGIVVDMVMIDNIMQTNPQEAAGLLSVSLVIRTLLFGLIPAWLVIKYCPQVHNYYKANNYLTEYKSKFRMITMLVIALILVVLPFTSGYASFIREHKITRFYANPTYASYSIFKYISQQVHIAKKVPLKHIAQDAVMAQHKAKPTLMILVVGETARADRFSLNGYTKETNPLLAKLGVVSFSKVSSCGTSTGVSVPCMFSALTRAEYDKEVALNQENALDVLTRAGVEVLWRDNNSDSKGVATRLKFQDFKSADLNPICDPECRDVGMLHGLDEYIAAKNGKDILIVMHQMGNHGPEYYKRYPKEFERFTPTCKTAELKDCSSEQINNSFDNAILYTDYFLAEVIGYLKKHDADYATAMLYLSDHGESLGEKGIYLHAAPYMIAPEAQTHVPVIAWTGAHFPYSTIQLTEYKDKPLSHDDLFCTLLGSFEVNTKICASQKPALALKR